MGVLHGVLHGVWAVGTDSFFCKSGARGVHESRVESRDSRRILRDTTITSNCVIVQVSTEGRVFGSLAFSGDGSVLCSR